MRGQCEGGTGAKKCLQDGGFSNFERVRGLFSKVGGSVDIGVVGGSAVAWARVVVGVCIEHSVFTLAPSQNSTNPHPMRVSSAPVRVFRNPRTLANTLAASADPDGKPAPLNQASPARGYSGFHDGSGAPPMRSQRERAHTAAPTRQNAPMGSAP